MFIIKSCITISQYVPNYIASATVSVNNTAVQSNNGTISTQMAEAFPYILSSGVLDRVIEGDIGMGYGQHPW